ncbi:hypothetical protein AzCIB_2647 [Azoarcus sp. CIB]|nr:hypothetical protein AzCIB_2647 [Azoarcus sp. CIB]
MRQASRGNRAAYACKRIRFGSACSSPLRRLRAGVFRSGVVFIRVMRTGYTMLIKSRSFPFKSGRVNPGCAHHKLHGFVSRPCGMVPAADVVRSMPAGLTDRVEEWPECSRSTT